MKYIIILLFSAVLILSGFSYNDKSIEGEWIICGDWMSPENIDSIVLNKKIKNYDLKSCDKNGIEKYSIWKFGENGSLDLTYYTGLPNSPLIALSHNVKWKNWRINKKQDMLTMISVNDKIKFKIVEIKEGKLKLKNNICQSNKRR